MEKHTPEPWRTGFEGFTIFGPDDKPLAVLRKSNGRANAHRIVLAVNCHDELIGIVRTAAKIPCDGPRRIGISCRMIPTESTVQPCLSCKARAAIAKATGE